MRADIDGFVVHVEPAGEASANRTGLGPIAITDAVVVLKPFWDLVVG